MHRIVFLLTYPIIWLFSILPFWVLHFLSDCIYVLLFYVFNYRKEVVLNNLKISFPEKDLKELKKIRKKFYHHFVDIFIEMIKSFTISEEEINKRYKYKNSDVFRKIEALDKSAILMGSHYANWEWIINIQSMTSLNCVGAYAKLSNPYYDKLIKKNRSRFGSDFIPTAITIKKIIENKQNNINSLYGLLSDQSPRIRKTHYWAPFLGVTVPIHTGAEMLAKKHDFSIIYMTVNKVKRSHYEIDFELLAESPKGTPDYEITDLFLEKVEKQIRETPEYYFWTHKRFKHMDKVPKESTKKILVKH
ncbi:lysophospholipid acyltransferase family protein [Flavicella sediminum]|uniref:lysophospholipid acyltransferase family protein n=1 Tax=Flavicella sediminum TaxID=2585141 RepID=UPI00111FE795|nr:lysophospholipid acyltransferase family protein [Flavicella sediminum]